MKSLGILLSIFIAVIFLFTIGSECKNDSDQTEAKDQDDDSSPTDTDVADDDNDDSSTCAKACSAYLNCQGSDITLQSEDEIEIKCGDDDTARSETENLKKRKHRVLVASIPVMDYSECLAKCQSQEIFDADCTECFTDCWIPFVSCTAAHDCLDECEEHECSEPIYDDDSC